MWHARGADALDGGYEYSVASEELLCVMLSYLRGTLGAAIFALELQAWEYI